MGEIMVLKLLGKLFTPHEDHGDVAGFAVTDKQTGQTVHRESFEAGRFGDQRLADKMVGKQESLQRKYAPSRFEVEAGLFNNRKSFEHFFPYGE